MEDFDEGNPDYVLNTDKDIDISMNKDPQGKWALYDFEDSSNNFVDNFVESGVYKLQSLPPGEKYSTGFVPIADNTDKNLEAAMRLSTFKLDEFMVACTKILSPLLSILQYFFINQFNLI